MDGTPAAMSLTVPVTVAIAAADLNTASAADPDAIGKAVGRLAPALALAALSCLTDAGVDVTVPSLTIAAEVGWLAGGITLANPGT